LPDLFPAFVEAARRLNLAHVSLIRTSPAGTIKPLKLLGGGARL